MTLIITDTDNRSMLLGRLDAYAFLRWICEDFLISTINSALTNCYSPSGEFIVIQTVAQLLKSTGWDMGLKFPESIGS